MNSEQIKHYLLDFDKVLAETEAVYKYIAA